ncbi:cyclin-like protein [Phlyctochytrium arcticum]|nr:cyclin-like protein [Phlyctochytrium arcticum]
MAPRRFCSTCDSQTEVEHDDAMGHVVCTGCGGVLEENAIVAEVSFMENAKGAAIAEGFSMGKDKARVTRTVQGGKGGRSMLSGQESRETTIMNGHRRIQDIAYQSQIQMNARQIESAQRFFNLAVINNFTKGRRLNDVAAACLYIQCRRDKTAHMLIDFADALSTNVYKLGASFLKLVQILHIDLPLVDPALYISRFAAKLDFEEKTGTVIRDANRLVQRMNRDWIQLGRRPAGICAACLFIAARMNGFKRTHREIVLVVKICEATLRKRLKEFQHTPSAELSVEQFQTIWLPESQNPPAFLKSQKRKQPEDSEEVDAETESVAGGGEDADLLAEMQDILGQSDTLKLSEGAMEGGEDDDEVRLSDLDDDPEIMNMVSVTEEEAEVKEILWTEENKDWILKQQLKEQLLKEKGHQPKKPKRARNNAKGKPQLPRASTPAEATRNLLKTKRVSKKINYDVIDSLFDIDEDEIRRKQGLVAGLAFSSESVTGFGKSLAEDEEGDDGDFEEE